LKEKYEAIQYPLHRANGKSYRCCVFRIDATVRGSLRRHPFALTERDSAGIESAVPPVNQSVCAWVTFLSRGSQRSRMAALCTPTDGIPPMRLATIRNYNAIFGCQGRRRPLPRHFAVTRQKQQASQSNIAPMHIEDLNEFRRGVGLCVMNRDGLVFAARRMDDSAQTWQMPQGGIDPLENPLVAAKRELQEETGIHPNNVNVVASIDTWLDYEFPTKVKNQDRYVRYRGQTQKWLLMEFVGSDDEIDLSCHGTPEFSEWRWMPLDTVVESVVDFKRNVYREVWSHFGPRIRRHLILLDRAV